jgi:hypothetical protein
MLKMESTGGLLGTAALAVMVGLFSDQASLKLRDVANTLFGSRNDKRSDKLDGGGQGADSSPNILSVSPSTLTHGTNPTPALIISGSNFAKDCVIRLNGVDRPPSSTAPTELKLNLKAEDIAKAGTPLVLVVVNPNKQTSNEVKIDVN